MKKKLQLRWNTTRTKTSARSEPKLTLLLTPTQFPGTTLTVEKIIRQRTSRQTTSLAFSLPGGPRAKIIEICIGNSGAHRAKLRRDGGRANSFSPRHFRLLFNFLFSRIFDARRRGRVYPGELRARSDILGSFCSCARARERVSFLFLRALVFSGQASVARELSYFFLGTPPPAFLYTCVRCRSALAAFILENGVFLMSLAFLPLRWFSPPCAGYACICTFHDFRSRSELFSYNSIRAYGRMSLPAPDRSRIMDFYRECFAMDIARFFEFQYLHSFNIFKRKEWT